MVILFMTKTSNTINTRSLHDRCEEINVGGIKYTVEERFAENGETLLSRFERILQNEEIELTEEEKRVNIKSEYVSAVGKEKYAVEKQ